MSAGREQPPLAQRIDRARRVVSHCSQAAIRAYDEEALLSEACRTLIDQGDYCMAWFAETRAGEDRLATLAHAVASNVSGVREDELPWTADLGPRMPTMRALLEQRPYVARGILDDPVLRQRHPEADSQGYSSISAFPLQFGPHGAGVLTVYAREPAAFAPEEAALLRELAGDMGIAVSVLRARKANDLLEERLENAELRYRSIVEQAPVGILQIDVDGNVLVANHALAEILGLPAEADAPRLEAVELARHMDQADLERVREAVAKGLPVRPLQMELRRRDGAPVWVEVRAKPANGGSPAGAIEAFVRDLTHERAVAAAHMAQERQRLEVVRLQELDRMRAEFMGRASHELNTPLTPILLQVQALQAAGQDPRLTRGLALVERNVLRLATLVKDLLSASAIEAGHADLRPAAIDLQRKAAEAADAFRDQAGKAGIELRHEEGGPVPAFADGQRVTQVLFNLVGNALKFTPRGGTVTLRCETQDDGRALCTVSDTGRGFPPEDLGRLFEPFARLHDHLADDPGGTGLGLFISKGIIEQSGGTLWARSAGPGQGAAFGFTLPPRQPEALPDAVSEPGRGIRAASGFEESSSGKGAKAAAARSRAPAAPVAPWLAVDRRPG